MAKEKDPRLTRAGVSGFNKPKRTPSHPTKSHVVVAKEGDEIKTIRLLGLDNKELAVRVQPLSLRKTKPDANHLRLAMQRILQKVRCQRLIGPTRRNGSGRSI
jgi:hypothetical protein